MGKGIGEVVWGMGVKCGGGGQKGTKVHQAGWPAVGSELPGYSASIYCASPCGDPAFYFSAHDSSDIHPLKTAKHLYAYTHHHTLREQRHTSSMRDE